MCVSQHLLKLCEELFEQITPGELSSNLLLSEEIHELRGFLEDPKSSGDTHDVVIIEETQSWLKEIWSLISRSEKCRSPYLSVHFNELQEHLDGLHEEASVPEEGGSWKDEYLIGNEEDDFYGETDDFCDELDGDDESY
jgi:hypothetical protein